jgi:hypothetical protein
MQMQIAVSVVKEGSYEKRERSENEHIWCKK